MSYTNLMRPPNLKVSQRDKGMEISLELSGHMTPELRENDPIRLINQKRSLH